jgi:hypothetical protein
MDAEGGKYVRVGGRPVEQNNSTSNKSTGSSQGAKRKA